MSTPFKMSMSSYGQGKNPIQMSDSPAKFIYGKKTTTKNEDGSTTNTRKNIFTGGTKSTTKSACLLYTSPSPRDRTRSRMPSSA